MSRLFDDAASDFAEVGVAVVTAVPVSLAGWTNCDDIANNQNLVGVFDASVAAHYFLLGPSGATTGDPVRFIDSDGTNNSADSTTGYSSGVWHHQGGKGTSTTSRDAFIDGGSKGSDTGSSTPAGLDVTTIGALAIIDLHTGFLSGDAAWCAIWNVALADVKFGALARGVNPFAMEPQNRVFLAPLHGNESPEPDYDQQNNLTLTGTARGSTNPPVELLEVYL